MSETLSQEQIDAMLKQANNLPDSNSEENEEKAKPAKKQEQKEENKAMEEAVDIKNEPVLTRDELDALGEVGNISMGTSATTLSKLLNKKVLIDAPNIKIMSKEELSENYPSPYVAVKIQYTQGLQGANVLNLKNYDVKVMTDLMMGGPGIAKEGPINDMHLSAMGEVMNQMIGSSSTALAEMLGRRIDISPPSPFVINYNEDKAKYDDLIQEDRIIRILFKLKIGDLEESEIMQIMPIDFAKELSSKMLFDMNEKNEIHKNKHTKEEKPVKREEKQFTSKTDNSNIKDIETVNAEKTKKNVRKVKFPDFDGDEESEVTTIGGTPIDLLLDVPLTISVELGKTKKKIRDILDFNVGTVIELNKIAGEAVDIVINGKLIGRGEVVVIDEAYGVRIKEVIKKEDRIKLKNNS